MMKDIALGTKKDRTNLQPQNPQGYPAVDLSDLALKGGDIPRLPNAKTLPMPKAK